MMINALIDEQKVKSAAEEISEYVAAPGKLLRPCRVCGQIRIAAAIKPGGKAEDEEQSICRGCITAVSIAEANLHRCNTPLIVGVDYCDICNRNGAISTYQWGNKKVRTCSDCGTHLFNLMQKSLF
jgi:hypothetical protein